MIPLIFYSEKCAYIKQILYKKIKLRRIFIKKISYGDITIKYIRNLKFYT